METRKPILNYNYVDCGYANFDEWAKRCAEDKDPLLEQSRAKKLEAIYNSQIISEEQHNENIAFLAGLEKDFHYVWSYMQRENSKMVSLVQDYINCFELPQVYAK
jgi:hypothetical protein